MPLDHVSTTDVVTAQVSRGKGTGDRTRGGGVFTMKCYDAAGNLKWQSEFPNLVVNGGLKHLNDIYFSGSGYTATWYLGLYGAAGSNTPAAGDTAASHPGWTENTTYSNATRPAATFAAATTADPSVITNSATPAVFYINGSTTVGGAFLITNSTKGGTTGVLFSAGAFSAPGDATLTSGDALTVTYTFSLDAV